MCCLKLLCEKNISRKLVHSKREWKRFSYHLQRLIPSFLGLLPLQIFVSRLKDGMRKMGAIWQIIKNVPGNRMEFLEFYEDWKVGTLTVTEVPKCFSSSVSVKDIFLNIFANFTDHLQSAHGETKFSPIFSPKLFTSLPLKFYFLVQNYCDGNIWLNFVTCEQG